MLKSININSTYLQTFQLFKLFNLSLFKQRWLYIDLYILFLFKPHKCCVYYLKIYQAGFITLQQYAVFCKPYLITIKAQEISVYTYFRSNLFLLKMQEKQQLKQILEKNQSCWCSIIVYIFWVDLECACGNLQPIHYQSRKLYRALFSFLRSILYP